MLWIVILILVLAGVGYYGYQKYKAKSGLSPKQVGQKQNNQQKSEIDTSNWKTYRNEEYRFDFKYPRNWTISDFNSSGFDGGIAIRSLNSSTEAYPFAISISYKFGNYKNPIEAFETDILPTLRKDMDHEIRDTKFNGYNAVFFTDLGITDTKNIVIVQGTYMIEISYMSDQRDTVYTDQILSTFKFIKPVSATEAIIPPEMQKEIPIGRVEINLWDRLINFFRSAGSQKVPAEITE